MYATATASQKMGQTNRIWNFEHIYGRFIFSGQPKTCLAQLAAHLFCASIKDLLAKHACIFFNHSNKKRHRSALDGQIDKHIQTQAHVNKSLYSKCIHASTWLAHEKWRLIKQFPCIENAQHHSNQLRSDVIGLKCWLITTYIYIYINIHVVRCAQDEFREWVIGLF